MTIHECKVYSPSGKLKKTHTAEEMQKHFWRDFGDIRKTDYAKSGVAERKWYKFKCKFCKKKKQSRSARAIVCKDKSCTKKYNQEAWAKRKR